MFSCFALMIIIRQSNFSEELLSIILRNLLDLLENPVQECLICWCICIRGKSLFLIVYYPISNISVTYEIAGLFFLKFSMLTIHFFKDWLFIDKGFRCLVIVLLSWYLELRALIFGLRKTSLVSSWELDH